MKNPTVLVVDDDPVMRKLMMSMLRVRSIEVVEADNGRAAVKILESGRYAITVIVSDIMMPEMDGIELLKHVRQTNQVPFVLFTGMNAVMESQQAFEMGANEFITKPIDKEGIQKIVALFHAESAIQAELNAKKEPVAEDFREIKIEDFMSTSTLKSDVYIRLSKAKFVKIARKGDAAPRDRISYYKEKNIDFLYVLHTDFALYVQIAAELAHRVLENNAASATAKVALLQTSTKLMVEHCFVTPEIDKRTLDSAQQVVESALTFASQHPGVMDQLVQLNTHSNRLYAHSVAVSFYSALLAREHGWDSETTLMRVALGGLLHDIGKREFAVELLNKSRKDLTRDESALLETHCVRGRDILMTVKGLPEEVALIAMNHHECRSGTGFPRRLKGEQISPLIRLVNVVDKFCSLTMPPGTGEVGLASHEALKRMHMYYADELDPAFFARLMTLCQFSIEKNTRKKSS